MKRLIAFGDSMTYGVGLKDCWPSTLRSSKFAWPEIVANAIGRKCINKSFPGSSNKRIWYTIKRFKFRPDDIVFVCWSYPNRNAIIHSPFRITNLLPSQTLDDTNSVAKNYYNELYSFYDADLMTELFIRDTENMLSNIQHYHMTAESFDKRLFRNVPYLKIFIGEFEDDYPKALDNDHLGEEGHKAFSKKILDLLGIENEIITVKPYNLFQRFMIRCKLI